MTRLLDLTGERYGRLTAVALMPDRVRNNAVWLCVCDCGQEKLAVSNYLRSGHTRSCGCLRREATIAHNQRPREPRPDRPCSVTGCPRLIAHNDLCRKHYAKAWRESRPKVSQVGVARLRKYGITQAAFDAMTEKQGGMCAICRKPPNARGLFVDHDHGCCPGQDTCGKCVRGLLCNNCNFMLGQAGESVETLRAAIRYLDHWS